MTLTDSTSNAFAPMVTAVSAGSRPLVPAGAIVTSTKWTLDRDAREILDIAIAQAFGDHVPASLRSDLAEGNAAEVLRHASEGSAMLVVGTRCHGGLPGLLLGSVSSACAEHASCPVLVCGRRSRP